MFGDYVELKLKHGDRLCTNADVADTHGLRDIPDAKYPVKLTFFRTSANAPIHFVSPLFSAVHFDYAFLTLDVLHVLDLGASAPMLGVRT